MDISKLQGAQSFTATRLEKPPTANELKALEKNGKVDLIVQDGDETVLISGESIDINEYDQRMGEALPSYEMGPYYNADLKPLKNMDENSDGKLTEDETRYGVGDAFSQGWDRVGKTIGGGAEVGSMYGMGYGYKYGGNTGSKVGVVAGGLLGGIVGLVSSPFTGGAAAVKTVGAQKNVQTWNLTHHLRDIR